MSDKECKGFHWIGQRWSSCDNCGRPWQEHEGLHTLRGEAGPFETEDDEWYIKPWAEIDGAPVVGVIPGAHVPYCNPMCSLDSGHWLTDLGDVDWHAHGAEMRPECDACINDGAPLEVEQ